MEGVGYASLLFSKILICGVLQTVLVSGFLRQTKCRSGWHIPCLVMGCVMLVGLG